MMNFAFYSMQGKGRGVTPLPKYNTVTKGGIRQNKLLEKSD